MGVTIKGDADCEVHVLEGFLCSHSSVFDAALKSDMEEAKTRVIKVPDAKKMALEDLCHCLISGGLPPSIAIDCDWQRVCDLLLLADKYAIAPLADACLFYISMMGSRTNASKLLLVSDRSGLTRLTRAVMNFTLSSTDNFNEVVNSEEYDMLSSDLLRIFQAYSETRKDISPKEMTVPLMCQWENVPREFVDDTDWQGLPKQSLRRACFERLLGTAGTTAELVSRLSHEGSDAGQTSSIEPDAKRQRTSD